MNNRKRIQTILLVALMICASISVGRISGVELFPKAQAAYKVGDIIQYGSYPQNCVEETPELKAAANSAKWKSYNYYTGAWTNVDEFRDHYGSYNYKQFFDEHLQTGDWMQFADFFLDGEKYRAVRFSQYRPFVTVLKSSKDHSQQDENGFTVNNIYYFKYESLRWKVLDLSTGLVLCENIIDSQPFQSLVWYDYYHNSVNDYGSYCYFNNPESGIYGENYKESSIRHWLNNDFLESTFTKDQKTNILSSKLHTKTYDPHEYWANQDPSLCIDVTTEDQVFLLSYDDALNSAYGFTSDPNYGDNLRRAKFSDYSKCQGLDTREASDWSEGSWMLRSSIRETRYYGYGGAVIRSDPYGNMSYGRSSEVAATTSGIRPAMCLSVLKNDATISTELFSEIGNTSSENAYNLGEETYSFDNFDECNHDVCDGGGHCLGFSTTSAGYYLGNLDVSLLEIDDPSKLNTITLNDNVKEPICHYQIIQGDELEESVVAGGSRYSESGELDLAADWNSLINYVKNHSYDGKGNLIIGIDGTYTYWFGDWFWEFPGGHAVNFLRYEVVNGQERIYIYDNNFPEEETYLYMDSRGAVHQEPQATFDVSYDALTFFAADTFLTKAQSFNPALALYAKEGTLNVKGAKEFRMFCGVKTEPRVMYELPKATTKIEVKPQTDNASVVFMDKEYTFGKVDGDTYGVLRVSTYSGASTPSVQWEIVNAPTDTPNNPTNPSNSTEPSSQEQQQQTNGCKYCGQPHTGIFGWLIQLIHNILFAVFGAKK